MQSGKPNPKATLHFKIVVCVGMRQVQICTRKISCMGERTHLLWQAYVFRLCVCSVYNVTRALSLIHMYMYVLNICVYKYISLNIYIYVYMYIYTYCEGLRPLPPAPSLWLITCWLAVLLAELLCCVCLLCLLACCVLLAVPACCVCLLCLLAYLLAVLAVYVWMYVCMDLVM